MNIKFINILTRRLKFFVYVILPALFFVFIFSQISNEPIFAGKSKDWEKINTKGCTFTATGENKYFILEPGFQIVLEDETERVTITVLNKTKKIGKVTTRVVEEKEEKNGKIKEISRNYFAICKETGDVFYFGEEVDNYKKGKLVNHKGAWLAADEGCKPGVIMPGKIKKGRKYFQELAPGKAMDRGEIISINETLKTPAGTFRNCIKILDTSALDKKGKKNKDYKMYAPGIGLIQDEDLLLVEYGFIKKK